ncbi:MAG: hypothetical protein RLZZ67_474 [Candidatus Parcubacteria bacterium]|jgi:DNA polymerase III delta prime subunit
MFPKDTLHHAYFIEGERALVLTDLEAFLKDSFKIIRQGHPDVHYTEYESFGIDEGRSLQEMQSLRPILGDKKIFIITLDSITSEAQNSLLKVFEEPTPGTHFFVISSSSRILLPTLRSRMVVVVHSSAENKSYDGDAKKFVISSLKERLEYVANIIEEKNKARAEEFLQALVAHLAGAGLTKASLKRGAALKEILTLTTYLKDRAPSLKLILERVALLDLN